MNRAKGLIGIEVFDDPAAAAEFNPPRCCDCRRMLTLNEEKFYEYRCEGCEGRWHYRVRAWRCGAKDEELDMLFSVPSYDVVKH